MRNAAIRIYQRLWPGCQVQDLREDGVRVHILDKEFGIDTLATMPSGQWLSIQEKYRTNKFLRNTKLRVCAPSPDFTQEHMNAVGTKHESQGEWFKLGSQLYFYGWANENETAFERWFVMDVPKYKLLVESLGGLDKIGKRFRNAQHGAATFYAIPAFRLRTVCLYSNSPQMTEHGGTLVEYGGEDLNLF